MSSVTEAQVSSLFSSLGVQKASLHIPNKLIIKIAAELLSKPVAYIYNQSTATGIVPDDFKISKLHQYIMDDVTDTGNYRPIATLSLFPKVLERLSYDQLYAFLEKHSILYSTNLASERVSQLNRLF